MQKAIAQNESRFSESHLNAQVWARDFINSHFMDFLIENSSIMHRIAIFNKISQKVKISKVKIHIAHNAKWANYITRETGLIYTFRKYYIILKNNWAVNFCFHFLRCFHFSRKSFILKKNFEFFSNSKKIRSTSKRTYYDRIAIMLQMMQQSISSSQINGLNSKKLIQKWIIKKDSMIISSTYFRLFLCVFLENFRKSNYCDISVTAYLIDIHRVYLIDSFNSSKSELKRRNFCRWNFYGTFVDKILLRLTKFFHIRSQFFINILLYIL